MFGLQGPSSGPRDRQRTAKDGKPVWGNVSRPPRVHAVKKTLCRDLGVRPCAMWPPACSLKVARGMLRDKAKGPRATNSACTGGERLWEGGTTEEKREAAFALQRGTVRRCRCRRTSDARPK